MKDICITDLRATLKNHLDRDEVDDFVDEVKIRAQARMKKRLEPQAIALNKTIDELLQERKTAASVQRLRTYKNIQLFKAARDQIGYAKTLAGEPRTAKGVNAFFGRKEGNTLRGHYSVVNRVNNTVNDYMSAFYTELEKEGVKDYFESTSHDEMIGKEIARPGSTNEPHAKKIGEIWNRFQKNMREALNREGIPVGEADEHIARLQHNADRLQSLTGFGLKDVAEKTRLLKEMKGDVNAMRNAYKKLSFEKWRNTIDPLLDKEKTFEHIEDENDFYRSGFDAMTSGVRKKFDPEGSPIPYGRRGMNIGNRYSKPRIFYFKDPESWITYNKRYGFGNVHDAIISQLQGSARILGLTRVLGTNPESMGKKIIDWARGQARGETDSKWKTFIKRAENVLDMLVTPQDRLMSGMTGKVIQMWRNFVYATSMSNVMVNSFGDVSTMASFAAREHGIPALETYQTIFGNLMKGMAKGERKEIALGLRVYSEMSMGNLFRRFGGEDSLYGKTARFVEMNTKAAGVDFWDSETRLDFGTLLGKRFYSELRKSYEALSEGEKHALRIEGIEPKEWTLLQQMRTKVDRIGKYKFIFPEHTDLLTDEDINKAIFDNKGTPSQIEFYKRDFHDRLLNYFTDQTSYGKVMPDESDIAFMMAGQRSDTIGGKIMKLLTMFKSYHVAATRRTLGRFIYGQGADSLYEAIKTGKWDYYGLMQYMMHSAMMGYINKAARNLLAGMALPDLSDKKEWIDILNSGGAFFLYGQILLNDLNRQHDVISFQGPGISKIQDLLRLTQSAVKGTTGDSQATIGMKRQIFSFIRRNIPMLNYWYTKTLVDHAFYNHWMNAIDPNYTYNLMKRAEQNNQHYLWQP